MTRLLHIVLATTLWSAAAAAQSQRSADEAAALAVVHKLFDAMRQNDSAMARPLFHAKARMITATMRNGQPAISVTESADGFIRAVGGARTDVWDERLSNEKVFVDGPLASVWTDYVFYRGTTLSHCGVDHFTLVREGDAWKILEVADTRRNNC